MNKELYENRVSEIMASYLKNIKECDQDPWKKKPWEPRQLTCDPLDKGDPPLDK